MVRSGGYIEVKPQYFEQIPIADISGKNKEELMVNTDKVMDLTRERQNTDNKFTTLLSNHFTDIKINKKLQNWPQLEYKDFLKELKKQQVKLSLSEESEWMQYFNEQKQKANDLQTQITQTDREIDRMVYDLYGLTEEEIGIVEESVG
ncbi:MAG: hypothetical protein U5L09_06580 [Bacteroidales bacterium]|nr:hypothetical protein [Bacteroidales bacterium]